MPDSPRASRRSAFTLLEVLVAIVILGGGVLAVASGASGVARMVGDAARHALAASVATARLERLTSATCAALSDGSATTRDIEERWTIAPLGAGPAALQIVVHVRYRVRLSRDVAPEREYIVRGATACR
jgi:prepilin-type N-terminal cleavage/methylation domain-containing protein